MRWNTEKTVASAEKIYNCVAAVSILDAAQPFGIKGGRMIGKFK